MRAFPGFFLSFLGVRFLREFYASFIEDPVGMAFVAVNGAGRPVGVIAGPLRPAGYFGRLVRRRWWAFAWASTWAVLRKPSVAPRLMRALWYRGDPPMDRPRALLSSIAVDPAVQGGGVGKTLVTRWLAEVQARGAAGAYLTTDADDNETVNRFYQRLGWRVEASYTTPEGRRMHRYVFDFPGTAAGAPVSPTAPAGEAPSTP